MKAQQLVASGISIAASLLLALPAVAQGSRPHPQITITNQRTVPLINFAIATPGDQPRLVAKLAKPQEHFWKTYFQRELLPLLSPQIVDSRHPFPFLNNKDIYYIAQLHSKNEGISYGIVPVSSQFERVLFVKDGETTCFAFVEELIAHYAATIFSASTVQKQ